ncbi:MAG: secretin N-terminal domain-containing protein [Pirellulales bacterium]
MSKKYRRFALACAIACGLSVTVSGQTPLNYAPNQARGTTAPNGRTAPVNPQLVQPAVGNSGVHTNNVRTTAVPAGGAMQNGGLIPLPAGVQTVSAAEQLNDPASIKVYEVPSDLIGAVGARLQIVYHGNPRVRVATEPSTGQLMVMAPESILRDITSKMQTLIFEAHQAGLVQDKGMTVASTKQQSYALRNLRASDLENALHRLAGPKLTTSLERNGELVNFKLANTVGLQDVMQVDRKDNTVTLLGGGASVAGWMQIIYALDMGQSDPVRMTHVMPLAPAEPGRVRKAMQLVRAAFQQPQAGAQDDPVTAALRAGQARNAGQAVINPQDPDEQATAIASTDQLNGDTGLFGDVQIEFIEDLDLVIIKGAKRDVQRTLEVIQQIKEKAVETQPEIEVMMLKHVDSSAVQTLVTELYEDVLASRQGQVSITSLGQPNALLLVGRKEAVSSVRDLINKLDQPLDPNSSLRVFRLLHASATDAETTVRDFFVDQPGGGDDQREGLGTRAKVIADYRTNSLIVQAAPRDLAEVAKLIESIDVEGTAAQNEVKIFRLRNALAADLQTTLNAVITGESTGGQGNQGGGGGGGGNSSASSPSTKLSIVSKGTRVDSGILAGVVVTADASQNALVVRAPAKSMSLIEQLVTELDQLPNAEAQIKVFPVRNGDPTLLAQTMQQLFGLPATAGQNGNGGIFGQNTQLQLAGLTAGGEGSLVPLRITTDYRTRSIIASGSRTTLEVIEAILLRLDADNSQSRQTEVIWLRVTPAQTMWLRRCQNFLNTQRTVTQTQTLLGQSVLFDLNDMFVVAEPTTNSVIVSANPKNLENIAKVIAKLDRRPPLVAVQVLMAEVTLSDQFEFGTELGLQDSLLFDRNSVTGGTVGSPVFNTGTVLTRNETRGLPQNVAGQGLSTFGVGRASSLGYGGLVLSAASESVGVMVRALQDANRLQILSRPQIMTMDNRPAGTLVGQLVPRVSGTTAATFGQTVQANDVPVGLELQVWPRVNEDGLIVMQVYVARQALDTVSSGIPIGFGTNGQVITSPIINSTTAQTTISAYSGQTVVFAGLIQKTRTSASRRIPYLADIPWVGALFRFDTESERRSELLVVLTPRIIQTDEDYEVFKQVETSRMSWCLADILEMHGDAGLSGGHGLWGPARGPIIFPDLQPASIDDGAPAESIIETPYGSELNPPAPIVEPQASGLIQSAPALQPAAYEQRSGVNRNGPSMKSLPPAYPSYVPGSGGNQNPSPVVPAGAQFAPTTAPQLGPSVGPSIGPTSVPQGYRSPSTAPGSSGAPGATTIPVNTSTLRR